MRVVVIEASICDSENLPDFRDGWNRITITHFIDDPLHPLNQQALKHLLYMLDYKSSELDESGRFNS
jgi:hypothetical protein